MSPRFFSFGTLSDGTEVTAGRLENTAGASLTVLDYVTALTDMTTAVVDGVVMVWVCFKKKVLK
jgi:hypothetical protein